MAVFKISLLGGKNAPVTMAFLLIHMPCLYFFWSIMVQRRKYGTRSVASTIYSKLATTERFFSMPIRIDKSSGVHCGSMHVLCITHVDVTHFLISILFFFILNSILKVKPINFLPVFKHRSG